LRFVDLIIPYPIFNIVVIKIWLFKKIIIVIIQNRLRVNIRAIYIISRNEGHSKVVYEFKASKSKAEGVFSELRNLESV